MVRRLWYAVKSEIEPFVRLRRLGACFPMTIRSRLDGEKPEEDEIRTKEEEDGTEGKQQQGQQGDGDDVSVMVHGAECSLCGRGGAKMGLIGVGSLLFSGWRAEGLAGSVVCGWLVSLQEQGEQGEEAGKDDRRDAKGQDGADEDQGGGDEEAEGPINDDLEENYEDKPLGVEVRWILIGGGDGLVCAVAA